MRGLVQPTFELLLNAAGGRSTREPDLRAPLQRYLRLLTSDRQSSLKMRAGGSTRLAIAEDVQLITYRVSRAAMQSRAPMGLRLPQRWHHVIGEMAEGQRLVNHPLTTNSSRDEPIVYRIDAAYRIVEVNDAWTRFANNNAAPELAGDAVRGRTLWEFIADPTTRALYEALVARARQGNPQTVLYRCDVPAAKRLMRMTIALDGPHVTFESAVAEESELSAFALWDRRVSRSGEPLRACSWCKRIEIGDHWVEVDAAIDGLGLLVQEPVRPVVHVTCPACYAAVAAGGG
jgi:hypothetical protein